MRVQVAVQKGEQRKLGDWLYVIRRGDDAAREPVPVALTDGERGAGQAFGEAVQRPRESLHDSRVADDSARRGHALEGHPDSPNRSEVAEQEGQTSCRQTSYKLKVEGAALNLSKG